MEDTSSPQHARPSVASLSRALGSASALNTPSAALTGRRSLGGGSSSTTTTASAAAAANMAAPLPTSAAPKPMVGEHSLVAQLRAASQEDLFGDGDGDDDEIVTTVKSKMTDPSFVKTGKCEINKSGMGGVVDERAWIADWYLASESRATAEALLGEANSSNFVIRKLPSPSTSFELLLRMGKRVTERVLETASDGGVLVRGSDLVFECLSDLVFHFSSSFPPSDADLPVRLKPADRVEVRDGVKIRKIADHVRRRLQLEGDDQGAPSELRPHLLNGPTASPGEPWKVQDVINWLTRLGLGSYAQLAFDHKLDGEKLLALDSEQAMDIGFVDEGDRGTLLQAVAILRCKMVPATETVTTQALLRKSFAVKTVNGKVKIFDTDTGEEIKELSSILGAFALPDADDTRGGFSWSVEEGWTRTLDNEQVVAEADLTPQDMVAWLDHVGMGSCRHLVQLHDIGGARMRQLTAAEMDRIEAANGMPNELHAAHRLFVVQTLDAALRRAHEQARWFQPNLDQDQLLDLVALQASGTFVITNNLAHAGAGGALEDDQPLHFLLAYVSRGNPDGHLVKIGPSAAAGASALPSGSTALGLAFSNKSFATLTALVEHYRQNPEHELEAPLVMPAPLARVPIARIDAYARAAPWFKVGLDRATALAALCSSESGLEGDFVVRSSESQENSLVLSYIDANLELMHTPIDEDAALGLHLRGSSLHFETLSELVHVYGANNHDMPYILHLPYSRHDHLRAPWYLGDAVADEAAEALQAEPAGTFRVLDDDLARGTYTLVYVPFRGDAAAGLASLPIDSTPDGLCVHGVNQLFASLTGLVAFYCLVDTEEVGGRLRHQGDQASGVPLTQFKTARDRVDPASLSSVFYLGGAPAMHALDMLSGAFKGAFVVRADLHDNQLLWLDFVAPGDTVQHLSIHNSPAGLHVADSTQCFSCLWDLVGWYCGANSELPYGLRMGWSPDLPGPAPPIGRCDHLSAPWFLPGRVPLEEIHRRLEFEPTASFLVRASQRTPGCYFLHFNRDGLIHTVDIVETPDGLCLRGMPKTKEKRPATSTLKKKNKGGKEDEEQGDGDEEDDVRGEAFPNLAALIAHHFFVKSEILGVKLRRPVAPHEPFRGLENRASRRSKERLGDDGLPRRSSKGRLSPSTLPRTPAPPPPGGARRAKLPTPAGAGVANKMLKKLSKEEMLVNTVRSRADIIGEAAVEPWCCLCTPKDEALKLLRRRPDGAFVIRNSSTRPQCLALSYNSANFIINELICIDSHGLFLERAPDYRFSVLWDLVRHYQSPTSDLTCPLYIEEVDAAAGQGDGDTGSSHYTKPEPVSRFRRSQGSGGLRIDSQRVMEEEDQQRDGKKSRRRSKDKAAKDKDKDKDKGKDKGKRTGPLGRERLPTSSSNPSMMVKRASGPCVPGSPAGKKKRSWFNLRSNSKNTGVGEGESEGISCAPMDTMPLGGQGEGDAEGGKEKRGSAVAALHVMSARPQFKNGSHQAAWLRLDYSGEQAVAKLAKRRDGSFLIHSTIDAWGALALVFNGVVHHFRLFSNADGVMVEGSAHVAADLASLVKFHSKTAEILPCKLLE